MKLWQYPACLSGAIITVVMALASISYNATLGTPDPAFQWLPVTNTTLFSILALAFDLGMVASVFGFLHWRHQNKPAAIICAALFAISSVYSIHSVRGYIALNVTKSLAPAKRSEDVYASIKLELRQAQEHLARLRTALLKANRRRHKILNRDIAHLSRTIQETRNRLAQTETGRHVSPLRGLEWFLAVTLWFFNATCWGAWFGYKTDAPLKTLDTVSAWLAQHRPIEAEHCLVLYDHYKRWCQHRSRPPLAQYSFYARLTELGAKKFRDGRNGPTKYAMPE